MSVYQIVKEAKVKESTVNELLQNYNKGLKDEKKALMKEYATFADKMTTSLWGQAYGSHTRLYLNNKKL